MSSPQQGEWTLVGDRRKRRNRRDNPKIVDVYWYGFDNYGNEKWYTVLNNGRIIHGYRNRVYDKW